MSMEEVMESGGVTDHNEWLDKKSLESRLKGLSTDISKIYRNDINSKLSLAKTCLEISEIKYYEDGRDVYVKFIESLPFDVGTFKKWVAIGRSSYIKSFVDSGTTYDLPNDYNSLYSLSSDKFNNLIDDKKEFIRESLKVSTTRKDIDGNIKKMYDDNVWVGKKDAKSNWEIFSSTPTPPEKKPDDRFTNVVATFRVDPTVMSLEDYWNVKLFIHKIVNSNEFKSESSIFTMKDKDIKALEHKITGFKTSKEEKVFLKKLEGVSKRKNKNSFPTADAITT